MVVMIAFVDSLLFLISLDLYLFMVWCQSVNACFPFSKLFFSWHFRCWDAFSFFYASLARLSSDKDHSECIVDFN